MDTDARTVGVEERDAGGDGEVEADAEALVEPVALALLPVALGHLDVLRLYLQERAAPAVGARAPLAGLARTIDEGAVRLTEVAIERGLIDVPDPRVSAFIVVGAIERLAHGVLQGSLEASPVDIFTTLIRLVLDGVRGRRARPEREERR